MKSIGAPNSHSQLPYASTEQSNINANLLIWKHVTTDSREARQRQEQKGKSSAHGMGRASSKLFSSVPSRISNYFWLQDSTAAVFPTLWAAQQEAENLTT